MSINSSVLLLNWNSLKIYFAWYFILKSVIVFFQTLRELATSVTQSNGPYLHVFYMEVFECSILQELCNLCLYGNWINWLKYFYPVTKTSSNPEKKTGYDPHVFLVFCTRYKILAPTEADKAGDDMKKVCQVILDAINLDGESYRMGHTKACSGSCPPCTSVLLLFPVSSRYWVLYFCTLTSLTFTECVWCPWTKECLKENALFGAFNFKLERKLSLELDIIPSVHFACRHL